MKLKVTQVILGIIVLLMLITVLFLTFQGAEDTVSISEKVRSIAVNLGYTGSLKQFRSDIHLVEYFGVGLAVALFFHVMGWKKCIGAVVAAIFGLIDETIKIYLPTREFGVMDLVKDVVGFGVAFGIVMAVYLIIDKKKNGFGNEAILR